MSASSRPRLLPVSLAVGAFWSLLLFAWDTWEAWLGFRKGLRKIEADAATADMIREAIAEYVARVFAGHLVLLVLATAWLWCWLRLLDPRGVRRLPTALLVGTLSTLALYGWQATQFPNLHDWIPWRALWVDTMTPAVQLVLHGLFGTGLLLLLLRRWRQDLRGLALRLGTLLAFVGAWQLLTWEPAPARAVDNAGPNIVIIGVDSLRPDHLASQGYFRDTAPHIDAFLSEAVLFEDAWTPLARTYPSWLSLLTGQLPIDLGIRDNLPEPSAMVPAAPTLPQVLSAEGWHTRFVTDDSRFSYMVPELGWQALQQPPVNLKNFVVSSQEPHYRAFHFFFHNRLGDWILPTGAFNQSFGKSYRPQRFIDKASQELAEASRHEHFLYAVHACFLHAPGDRPWPWHQLHGQRGYEGRNRFRYLRSGSALFLDDGSPSDKAQALAEQDRRVYDSGIDMADRLVAETMDQLREGGLLDDTIVVLLSDHGEEHFADDLPYDYQGPNHGFHPYGDGQHRVLLAIRFPDGRGAGEVVEAQARLMDVLPTLAEALGLTWPAPIRGESLLPVVAGQPDLEPRQVYIETGVTEKRYWNPGHVSYPFKKVSERYEVDRETGAAHIRPEFHEQLVAAKDRVLQRGDWKLVYRPLVGGEKIELFDRVADPFNRTDLSKEHPLVVARLGLELAEHLQRDGIESREGQWRSVLDRAEAPAELQP